MSIDFQQLPHAGNRSLVPYKPGKSIEELKREKGITDIIKMASNENPSGCSPLALSALRSISPHLAASELSCNSLDWLPDHLNLTITRTFSKIYGMAGLRLGYAIANRIESLFCFPPEKI